MLHHLEDPVAEDADPPQLPERLAAKSLFRWEVRTLAVALQGYRSACYCCCSLAMLLSCQL